MKTLVLGRGFLGKAFEKAGFEVWGKDKLVVDTGNPSCLMSLHEYDVIVNCIAKSNTRWCEDPKNWNAVEDSNVNVPALLSKFCNANGIRFVHVSTGCLYNDDHYNQRTMHKEDSFLEAHCRYTLSKWLAEVRCSDKDLIIRPRLYFGSFADRNNLLCKLPKFEKYVGDKNSFTSVRVIVESMKALLDARQIGVFNVACKGVAGLHQIAEWAGVRHWDGDVDRLMSGEDLRVQEGLYLVNNTMNTDKLERFYEPPALQEEVEFCAEALRKESTDVV